jgi:small subunit ribosomal protein S6
MLLLDNREVRQGWQALKDNIAGVFRKHGTAVKSSRLWDERRLAYPIARQRRGTYLLVYFESETGALAGLRRDLELSETVLRNLIRTCEEIPATAYEPEAEFDESKIREEETPAPAAAAEADADDVELADGDEASEGGGEEEEEAPAKRRRRQSDSSDDESSGGDDDEGEDK